MKGEALITIKTKDGKIKQQVKKDNVVFDLPKELIKNYFNVLDLGSFGNSPTSYEGNSNAPILQIIDFTDWFGSIKVNDEECSITDFTDWKMPVLYGGEFANSQTNRTRYAYIDTANSSKNNNIMKKVYTWNNCPEFTIKSINLGHKAIQANEPKANIASRMLCRGFASLVKSGNFYFRKSPYTTNIGTYLGATASILYRKSNGFYWTKDYGRKDLEKVLQVGYNGGIIDGLKRNCIYPLKDNEIALLRSTNEITTDNSEYNIYYLHIIDATTGTLKRSFPLTQFNEFVGSSNSNHYIDSNYIRIVTTSFGNFIVMSKTNSAQDLFVWKIPEQSEMSNYSNNESISVYADLTSTGIRMVNGSQYLAMSVINEYLIMPGNTYADDKTIRINNDPQNPFTAYTYIPFNNSTSGNSVYDMGVFNKYYTSIYLSWEDWYNTTALNLSEGVSVAQGDTVTIEYTITAN